MTFRNAFLLAAVAVLFNTTLSRDADAGRAPRLYVTHQVSDDVWVIDPSSLEVVTTVQLPPQSGAEQSVVSADGSRLYTLNSALGIAVIDTASNELLRLQSYAWSFPGRALAISPEGGQLFVATAGGVVGIDAESLAETRRNTTLTDTFGLTVATEGDTVYASNLLPARLSALSSQDLEHVGEADLPPFFNPERAVLGPLGDLLYVACVAGIVVVDARTLAVTKTLPGPAADLRVSPDGATLYVASSALRISAVDTATGAAEVMLPGDGTGRGVGSVELALTPDGTRLFANDALGDRVLVFDTATRALVAEVAVGSSPSGVTVGEVITSSVSGGGCRAASGRSQSSALLVFPALLLFVLRRQTPALPRRSPGLHEGS